MRSFRDLQIQQRLIVAVAGTTAAALLLAGAAIVISDDLLFRDYVERDITLLSAVLADNSTAALAFNDPQAAAQTLMTLRERPHIVLACVYRTDGTVLATYSRKGENAGCPPPDTVPGVHFLDGTLTAAHPVTL